MGVTCSNLHSKISVVARWRLERRESDSRKLSGSEYPPKLEPRGIRGDEKTRMDAKLFYYNININCSSPCHCSSGLSGLGLSFQV